MGIKFYTEGTERFYFFFKKNILIYIYNFLIFYIFF